MTALSTVASGAAAGPKLADGRGELCTAVVEALRSGAAPVSGPEAVAQADPWGEDLLALYLLYDLHYRGFAGVDEDREWDPDLLRLRLRLRLGLGLRLRLRWRAAFCRCCARAGRCARTVDHVFAPLLGEPADLSGSLSHHLRTDGDLRSLYHFKARTRTYRGTVWWSQPASSAAAR
ncbi:hypothetical protein [Streptomyces xanthophaeus]